MLEEEALCDRSRHFFTFHIGGEDIRAVYIGPWLFQNWKANRLHPFPFLVFMVILQNVLQYDSTSWSINYGTDPIYKRGFRKA